MITRHMFHKWHLSLCVILCEIADDRTIIIIITNMVILRYFLYMNSVRYLYIIMNFLINKLLLFSFFRSFFIFNTYHVKIKYKNFQCSRLQLNYLCKLVTKRRFKKFNIHKYLMFY